MENYPWEDFAETVNVYLDLMAIASTCIELNLPNALPTPLKKCEIENIVDHVLRIAVSVSEFNSDLGLPSLLPENLPEPVVNKLAFIHELVQSST
jgi:hypothetical protein